MLRLIHSAINDFRIHRMVLLVLICSQAGLMAQQAGSESTNSGITILPVVVQPNAVPAGAAVKMCYTWKAVRPTSTAFKVFVHIVDDQRRMILQDDHVPPVSTSTPGWQGTITYERRKVIPAEVKEGKYRIIVGLYNKSGRTKLTAGEGVILSGDNSYQVGVLTIDSKAPWPPADTEQAPSLDLSGFHLTFHEEFDGPGRTRFFNRYT